MKNAVRRTKREKGNCDPSIYHISWAIWDSKGVGKSKGVKLKTARKKSLRFSNRDEGPPRGKIGAERARGLEDSRIYQGTSLFLCITRLLAQLAAGTGTGVCRQAGEYTHS